MMKAGPAFAAGDPAALSEFVDVAMLLFVIGGLWARRRWAWWLGAILSAAGWMLATVLLGALEVPELRDAFVKEVPDLAIGVQQLTLIGAASFVAFAALLSGSARRAIRE
jgi:hypothetical protein